MNLHNFHEQTESRDGKTSLTQRLRKMSTRAKIVTAVCAVLVLAAAGTGVFFLTRQSGTTLTAAAKASSAVPPKPVVTALSLSQSTVSLDTGKTVQITATSKPVSTDVKVVWTSSDEKVATISSDGLVTAVSKGTCTVTASVGTAVSASVQVTVKDPGDEEIELLKAYLKNGVKVPKLSADTLFPNSKASVKALDDAAIVDLNGDDHYELIVEHLFKYIDANSSETTQCLPFFEVYYVKDGKVVKSPEDFGRENWESTMSAGFGTSTESIDYYLAQDPETKMYYFVRSTFDSAEAANGITGPWSYTANVLDGARVTPVMKLYAGLGQFSGLNDKQNDDSFIFALDKTQVNRSSLEEAEKRLKAVCFDVSCNNSSSSDSKIGENTSFIADHVKVYKNSKYPESFLPDIIQKDAKKIISNPSILLGMNLTQIQKAYGDTLRSGYRPSESTYCGTDDMEEYPYTLGIGSDGSNDDNVWGVIVRRHNANIYKDAKIGMTYTQIKEIFGDHMTDLEENYAEADGTGFCQAYINNIRYQFSFDDAKASSQCLNVAIIKQ